MVVLSALPPYLSVQPSQGLTVLTTYLVSIPNHVQQSHDFRHTSNHPLINPFVDLPSSPNTRLLTDITRKDAKGMRKHVSHLGLRVRW
jgi:hypothetical protein